MDPETNDSPDTILSLEGVRRSASRAILWNVVLVPLLGVLSLASSMLVARALSLDEYRVYGLAAATIASLILYSDLGISSTVARFTPELRALGGRATKRFLGAAAKIRLSAVVVVVSFLVLARFISPAFWDDVLPFHGASLWLIVVIVAAQSLARVLQYFLTGLFRRKTIGVIQLLATASQALLVIAAAAVGLGVSGILAAIAIASLLELVLSRSGAGHHDLGEQEAQKTLPKDATARAVRFSCVSFAEKLANYLASPYFVIFQVAALGAAVEVALFTVATEFAMRIVSLLSVPFSGVTLPLFSSVDTESDSARLPSVLRLYLMLLLLLFVPTAALLASVADPLIPLVYGERYAGAVPMLRWLIPFTFLEYTVYSALLTSLMVRGKYALVLFAKIPLLVGVVLVSLAIPHWGATGAVIAFGSARFVSAALLLAFGIRELGLVFPGAYAAKVGSASIAGAAAIAVLQPYLPAGWLGLVSLGVAGALVFVIAYKLVGGMDAHDRERIVSGLPARARVLSYLL